MNVIKRFSVMALTVMSMSLGAVNFRIVNSEPATPVYFSIDNGAHWDVLDKIENTLNRGQFPIAFSTVKNGSQPTTHFVIDSRLNKTCFIQVRVKQDGQLQTVAIEPQATCVQQPLSKEKAAKIKGSHPKSLVRYCTVLKPLEGNITQEEIASLRSLAESAAQVTKKAPVAAAAPAPAASKSPKKAGTPLFPGSPAAKPVVKAAHAPATQVPAVVPAHAPTAQTSDKRAFPAADLAALRDTEARNRKAINPKTEPSTRAGISAEDLAWLNKETRTPLEQQALAQADKEAKEALVAKATEIATDLSAIFARENGQATTAPEAKAANTVPAVQVTVPAEESAPTSPVHRATSTPAEESAHTIPVQRAASTPAQEETAVAEQTATPVAPSLTKPAEQAQPGLVARMKAQFSGLFTGRWGRSAATPVVKAEDKGKEPAVAAPATSVATTPATEVKKEVAEPAAPGVAALPKPAFTDPVVQQLQAQPLVAASNILAFFQPKQVLGTWFNKAKETKNTKGLNALVDGLMNADKDACKTAVRNIMGLQQDAMIDDNHRFEILNTMTQVASANQTIVRDCIKHLYQTNPQFMKNVGNLSELLAKWEAYLKNNKDATLITTWQNIDPLCKLYYLEFIPFYFEAQNTLQTLEAAIKEEAARLIIQQ